MSAKTPVMILQEFMVQRKGTPEFDLTHDGGGTHEPIFHYIVRAHPVTATGSGRSKKEAKHEAARNALKRLAEIGLYSPPATEVKGISQINRSCSTPDSPERLGTNYVGSLKDFCIEKKLPDPLFELISDIGPPHARQFTVETSVGTIKTSAMAGTKKIAKQISARKMLQCLIDTVETGGIVVPYEDFHKYDKIACELRDETKNTNPNLSRKISDYSQSLKEIELSLRKKAIAILEISIGEPIEKMEQVLKALDILYTVQNFPSNNNERVLVGMQIQTDPEFLIIGFGKKTEEAKIDAAKRTLDFLNTMLA